MASRTLASDAALEAQDKRLLTRDWVDSNSRKSKYRQPGTSWDPREAHTKTKTRTERTNDGEGDCKNAGVSRGRDENSAYEVSPEETKDGTIGQIRALREKNKRSGQILEGFGSEWYDQEIIEPLKEGASDRNIAEKLGGSHFRDVEDSNGQDIIEDVEEDGDELGFAERLFKTCLHLFRELWLELSAQSPSPKCIRDGLLVEGLGKLYLWGESFQDGTLDTALEQSDELREDVLKIICRIGRILTRRLFPMIVTRFRRTKLEDSIQYLTLLSERANAIISGSTSEADSDSDDTEEECDAPDGRDKSEGTVGRDIRLLAQCLMDLVPTLEQSLPRVGKLARSALLAPPPAFRVSEPALTYVRNVYDKYPQADIKLTERLGEANWQRHVKVRNSINQVANDEAVESKAFVIAPFSEFQDSALGSSIQTHSQYAASAASHTSFVSSLADGEERSIRVPPTPAEVSAGEPFQCHICGQTLHNIRNRVDWKIHVFADLQPYICTFSTCKDALVQFPTRKWWVDHEFDEHRVNRSWVCPDCSVESFSLHAWDGHLQLEHGIIFSGRQHSIALGSALKVTSKPIDEQECPMCKIVPGTTRRAFSTHVGRHMEQIALAVLPRETEDDLEGSSVGSDLPIHDQRKETNPSPDLAPSLNASGGSLNQPEKPILDHSETNPFVEIIDDMGDHATPNSDIDPPRPIENPSGVLYSSRRIWTDRSGSFRVEAKLIGRLKDGQLLLRKLSGVNIVVPIVKMAVEDLKYIEIVYGVSLDWEKVGAGGQAGSLAGHTPKDGPWKCDQCPEIFSLNRELQRHQRFHFGVKLPKAELFDCEDCNKRFGSKDALERHFLIKGCPNSNPGKVKDHSVSSDHFDFEDETLTIKCICGHEEDDGNTVLCEMCDTWQHIKCYYHSSEKVADVHNCADCMARVMETKKLFEPLHDLGDEFRHTVSTHDDATSDNNGAPENWNYAEVDTRPDWMMLPLDPEARDTLYEEEHRSATETDNNPRLDRTISDVYADSLYNPEPVTMNPTTEASLASNQSGLHSTSRTGFMERFEFARNVHPSPRLPSPSDHYLDGRSAFRIGSPLREAELVATNQYLAQQQMRLQQQLINVTAAAQQFHKPAPQSATGIRKSHQMEAQARPVSNQSDLLPPHQTVFSERLQAANDGHLSARSQSPATTTSRERSPFRQGSEFAAKGYSDPSSPVPHLGFAARIREYQKAKADALALARHQHDDESVAPKVIAPRDAHIDPDETEDEEMPSLSSQQNHNDRTNPIDSLPSTELRNPPLILSEAMEKVSPRIQDSFSPEDALLAQDEIGLSLERPGWRRSCEWSFRSTTGSTASRPRTSSRSDMPK